MDDQRALFEERLAADGCLLIHVRLLSTDEGGRRNPLTGQREYRVNWSIGVADPSRQTGGWILLEADSSLEPGEATVARLWRAYPAEWADATVGVELVAYEGEREVARATVLDVLPPRIMEGGPDPDRRSLENAVQQIRSREDLAQFIGLLEDDLAADRAGWENPTLDRYLNAVAAWTLDLPGYFENRAEAVPEVPTWRLIGMILLAAKSYE